MALISSYGNEAELPSIRPLSPGTSPLEKLARRDENLMFSAVTFFDFHAAHRDPNSPDFINSQDTIGINLRAGGIGDEQGIVHKLLIEGCTFRSFTTNVIQSIQDGILEEVTFRRNAILDNYSGGGKVLAISTNRTNLPSKLSQMPSSRMRRVFPTPFMGLMNAIRVISSPFE